MNKGENLKSHKDLNVWKKSIDFIKDIYELTLEFPQDEKYGLANQIKRASVSIASNIAEGAARQTKKEFIQFLYISLGSASELDTQLEIVKKIFKPNEKNISNLQNELEIISKMVYGLINNLKNNERKK